MASERTTGADLSFKDERMPAGRRIIDAPGPDGTGNRLYLFPDLDPPLVLKVYRYRRSRFREFAKDLSQRWFEGKTGATARARCATESALLKLWSDEGFDTVRHVDRALPADVDPPALWMEYMRAPTLRDVVNSEDIDPPRKIANIKALGADCCRRHGRAKSKGDARLLHEHGNICHFFVDGERLVAFDLEHAFRESFPVLTAMAKELAGLARSILRSWVEQPEELLRAFVEGYEDHNLLQEAVRRGGPRYRIGSPKAKALRVLLQYTEDG